MAETAAWYRKYRPMDFSDYIGENIKQVVSARFTVPENRPNVIMVHGSRGCGKTTFARIIPKYYLCENQTDGKPCEVCEICQTINDTLINGETGVEVPGVVEIDNTTANGKDAIQDIIADAIIDPMYTKFKILILDECHMITKQGQNSLLKVIEDIPEFLVVIFCTTNPDDVLGTIHSRCQLKLEVKKKSVDEMAQRLLYIATKEGLTTSIEALKIISKKADRVPREAINMLEGIAKNYSNKVTIDNVRESTGDVAAEVYMGYFTAANTALEDVLIFNKKLKELDISAKAFISGLTRFVLDCMYIRHAIALEDYPVEYIKRVKDLFKIYTSNEFDALLQVIEYASKMIGEDEAKNELIITTTALRIGKIGILASGLGRESVQAEKENKQSIVEYRKQAEKDLEHQLDKVETFSPTKEKLSGLLRGMTDVSNTEGIVITASSKNTSGEADAGFFSPDALDGMLEG